MKTETSAPSLSRRLAVPPIATLVLTLSLVATTAACGDAYSLLTPQQRSVADMRLFPNSAQPGEVSIVALITTPPQPDTFLIGFDFGDDIDLALANIGGDENRRSGCRRPAVDLIFGENDEERASNLAVCLDLVVGPDAVAGVRTVELEVDSAGDAILGRTDFVVSRPTSSASSTLGASQSDREVGRSVAEP